MKSNKTLPIKTEPAKPEISEVEKAKQVIEQNRKQNIQDCAKEIDEVLKKHGCSIDCAFAYSPREGLKKQVVVDILKT